MTGPIPPMGLPGGTPSDPEDGAYRLWLMKKAEWWRWHQTNPEIWRYFEQFSYQAVARGRKKISHWLVINRIRWEVFITTNPIGSKHDDFKISNDYIAFYARYWKHRYPMHAGLFTTKRMIGEPRDSPLIGS